MRKESLIKTLPLAVLVACSSTNAPKTTPAVYTYESDANGFNTKSYFYDNGSEVVAIDTQFTPDLAQKSLEYLRTKTQNPVTYVVVTHPNPDKFNGISEFKKLGAKVIASDLTARAIPGTHAYKKYFFVNMAKMFTEETYPQLASIDQTFRGNYDLRLKNGEVLKLSESGIPGVSTNQTLVFIPSQNSVIVGDLVHHKAHAWLEGGIEGQKASPNINSWIKNLELIQKGYSSQTLVLGGRGEAASVATAIPQEIAYLKKADAIVASYVKSLGKRASELKTDKAGVHHKAIAERFAQAFPDYALNYMIEYGVYGLAQSKL